jgi:hypothetical protein
MNERLPSLVDWVFSPDWVTPEQAAFLMGRGYDLATIHELNTIGHLICGTCQTAGS